jgi:hypothetical protein
MSAEKATGVAGVAAADAASGCGEDVCGVEQRSACTARETSRRYIVAATITTQPTS